MSKWRRTVFCCSGIHFHPLATMGLWTKTDNLCDQENCMTEWLSQNRACNPSLTINIYIFLMYLYDYMYFQPCPWPSGKTLAFLSGRSGLDTLWSLYQRLEKWYMLFPYLAFSTSGKSIGVKHTVLPDSQFPTVAFTVLAQPCGPKANEKEMGAAPFPKMVREGTFIFEI